MNDQLISLVVKLDGKVDRLSQDVLHLRHMDEEHKRNIERFWSTEWPQFVHRVDILSSENATLRVELARVQAKLDERTKASVTVGGGAGVVAGGLSAVIAKLLGF